MMDGGGTSSYLILVLMGLFSCSRAFNISGEVTLVMVDFFAEREHYKFAQLVADDGTTYNIYDKIFEESLIPGSHMSLDVHEIGTGTMGANVPPSFETQAYSVDEVFSEEPPTSLHLNENDSLQLQVSGENQYRGSSHSLLVIRLCYRSHCPCPGCTEVNIRKWLWRDRYNNDGLYRETSYSLLSWPEDKGAILTVNIDKEISSCDVVQMKRDGESAAMELHKINAQSPNPSKFMHVTFYPPSKAGCPWGGVAWGGSPWRPAKHSFMNYGGMLIIAHELGHNLGASHDSTDRDDDGEKDSEYGDGTGLMGQGNCGFTAVRRALFGFIPQSAQVTHPGCGLHGPSNITVQALDINPGITPGHKSLVRIPRHGGGHYYISFRRDRGYDAHMRKLYKSRVHVHVHWKGNPLIIAMFDDATTCKVNGKGGGERCFASTAGWSSRTVGGQHIQLQVVSIDAEKVNLRIHTEGKKCPPREGLLPKEVELFNPALSSYVVKGGCGELGIGGYARPAGQHGLGNENNIGWCSDSMSMGVACQKEVEELQCASGRAELLYVKSVLSNYGDGPEAGDKETMDFRGSWKESGKHGLTSQIYQTGRNVTATNPRWGWSPATGTVSGNRISIFSKYGILGSLKENTIHWTNGNQWWWTSDAFKMFGCTFQHYAQYQCKGAETTVTTTSTTTTTTNTNTMTTTTVPTSPIRSGDTIFLKTLAGYGTHIDVEAATVQARWQSMGGWQAIIIEREHAGILQSGDIVYLKVHTGAHIRVKEQDVRADWNDHGSWQALTIEKRIGSGAILDNDLVCFKAHTGKHLDAESGDVRARWEDCGALQTMLLQKEVSGALFSGDSIHLLAHTGKRLDVEGTAVRARWTDNGLWQTFHIRNYGGRAIYSGDEVFIEAYTGALVDVQGAAVQARWKDWGDWQKLVILKAGHGAAIMPGDTIFLQAHTGKMLDIEGDISSSVRARYADSGAWQALIVEKLPDSRRLKQTAADKFASGIVLV